VGDISERVQYYVRVAVARRLRESGEIVGQPGGHVPKPGRFNSVLDIGPGNEFGNRPVAKMDEIRVVNQERRPNEAGVRHRARTTEYRRTRPVVRGTGGRVGDRYEGVFDEQNGLSGTAETSSGVRQENVQHRLSNRSSRPVEERETVPELLGLSVPKYHGADAVQFRVHKRFRGLSTDAVAATEAQLAVARVRDVRTRPRQVQRI